jgi:hypothetical protein
MGSFIMAMKDSRLASMTRSRSGDAAPIWARSCGRASGLDWTRARIWLNWACCRSASSCEAPPPPPDEEEEEEDGAAEEEEEDEDEEVVVAPPAWARRVAASGMPFMR